MTTERKIYKPRPVTGFPEWLPEIRLVEQQWFDHVRKVFESYGFCSIETPSVEELDVLRAKGEVDKEIYVLERLHRDENEKSDARLALHFDQTVPLARYVAQNFNDLVFPFKRYQMQRVWRGERPQAGRFREFYQCDIDVIGIDNLPIHFDAEMPAVMWEVMSGLPGIEGETIQMQISNRKILMGLMDALGVADPVAVTRVIDKIEKIGAAETRKQLEQLGLNTDQCDKALALADIKTSDPVELRQRVAALGVAHDGMMTGLEELAYVMENLSHLPPGAAIADLSIVRGLDYYTGTVYETRFVDDPTYGSICSGGRYDDLAGSYINKHLPGVGISVGFSRLFDRMRLKGKLSADKKSPSHVLMVLPAEEQRASAAATAQALRKRGLNVELFHAAKKIPDQLKYASRKGIPFVWFPDTAGHQVKNMQSGEQVAADPATWWPDAQ